MSKPYNQRYSKPIASNKKSIGILILSLLVFGIGIWGYTTNWKFIENKMGIQETDYTFYAVDAKTLESNEWTEDTLFNVYRMDISDLTATQLKDRNGKFEFYELDEACEDGESYEPSADYIYMVIANRTDMICNAFVPLLGDNIVPMCNTTADVEMLAFSDILGTTLNRTDSRKWTISLQTIDSDGEATELEGYQANYDFVNDVDNFVVIDILFNTTAAESFVEINGVECEVSSTHAYAELPITLLGSQDISVEFSSGLGVTFEVIGISVGYGNSDSYTSWDGQN